MASVVVPASLLLLSPVPWPPSQSSVRAAYHDPLAAVLKQLFYNIRKATVGASLDVALPIPILAKLDDAPRNALYPQVQALVAAVYKLICVIAAKERINVEDAEGIDVRILLLARPRERDSKASADSSWAPGGLIGSVVDVKTLARSQRPWQTIYAVDDEQAQLILHDFLVAQDNRLSVQKVPGGVVQVSGDESVSVATDAKRHSAVIVGGTWDHIHIGHKLLLTMFAFMLQPGQGQPPSLSVGITGDELLKEKKHPELLESWSDRQASVSYFLRSILDFRPLPDAKVVNNEVFNPGPNGHAVHCELGNKLVLKLVEIADPFGPTITDQGLTALIVSAETRSGGKAVNDKRIEQGWAPLEVYEVEVLDAEDDADGKKVDETFQSKLSSTSIRKAISEKGRLRSKA